MPEKKEFLTIKEAIELADSSKSSVYRWIRSGRIVPHRLPSGLIRLKRSDVLRNMESDYFGDLPAPRDPSMG